MAIRSIVRVYREAYAGLPKEVWLLSLAALVNRAGTMVLPFFSLFLIHDRGVSVTVAGQLIGLYGVGSIAGSYLGGWLSDRVGAVRTQRLSLLGSGVGFLAIIFVQHLAALAAAIFVVSVIAEAFRPAAMTAVAERSPKGEQARSFALLRLAINVGMAFGPAVGGLLALHSYDWLFVGDALTCWGAAALLLLLPRPGRAEETSTEETAPPEVVASPWRDGPFMLLMFFVIVLAACFLQVFTTLPLYLRQDYGFREDVIGLLLAFNAGLIVIFEMVLIHRAGRGNRLLMIALGGLLTCAGLGILPFGSSVAWAALSVLIWTFGEMLSLPLLNAVIADRAAPGNRGRYMGIYTMAFSFAFVLAPLVGTWVFERYGGDVLWFGVAAAGIPLFFGTLALAPMLRKSVTA